MKLLVTGAAGFIGSTYVRLVADEHDVVVLDKLTYAGRRDNLPEGVPLVVGAIEDPVVVREVMEGVDAVVNFAADSHVDRSIADQEAFARTHVIGTGNLLDAARELKVPRYLQVSTDEVYGSIASGSFTEESPLDPSSPYSATKAAGDLLVSAHAHTYGIEAVICRGSNNYGPRQYPEKLIPLMILNALNGDSLPVYGDGRQVRNWLFVEDFCRGIHTVLERGRPGQAYNVGGPDECENLEVVSRILELTGADESLIEHVTDRPGHDRRYSLSSEKLRSELGWEAQVRFGEGLAPDGRLVPRQRALVGADPLGRVPRVLRAPLRAGAGLSHEPARVRRPDRRPARAGVQRTGHGPPPRARPRRAGRAPGRPGARRGLRARLLRARAARGGGSRGLHPRRGRERREHRGGAEPLRGPRQRRVPGGRRDRAPGRRRRVRPGVQRPGARVRARRGRRPPRAAPRAPARRPCSWPGTWTGPRSRCGPPTRRGCRRVLSTWDAHLVHPSLPRTPHGAHARGRLRGRPHGGAPVRDATSSRRTPTEASSSPSSSSSWARRRPRAWADEQRALAERGEFYFACIQFCFAATAPPLDSKRCSETTRPRSSCAA